MEEYNINTKIDEITPPVIKGGSIMRFIKALANILFNTINDWRIFSVNTRRALSYNCQIPQIQRLLNDYFDNDLRRIKVYDGTERIPLIVYRNNENRGIIVPFVILHHVSDYIVNPFVIDVSNVSLSDEQINQIEKLINTYKLCGKQYVIKTNNNG